MFRIASKGEQVVLTLGTPGKGYAFEMTLEQAREIFTALGRSISKIDSQDPTRNRADGPQPALTNGPKPQPKIAASPAKSAPLTAVAEAQHDRRAQEIVRMLMQAPHDVRMQKHRH